MDHILSHTSTTSSSKHIYLDELFQKLTAMTKMSNGLPSKSNDFDFYASFPDFRASLDETGDGILDLLQHLYTLIGSAEIASPLDLSTLGSLTDEDNFEQMSDVLDLLMEAVDANIDEAQGIDRTTMQQYVGKNELKSSSTSNSSSSSTADQNITALSSSSVSTKPQVFFKWDIDNSRASRFRPRILEISKTKPNAISALDRSSPKSINNRERLPSAIRNVVESHARNTLGADVDKMETEAGNYGHPYKIEITSLSRSSWQYDRPTTPKQYKGLKSTKCTWVETTKELTAMCGHLAKYNEYAIDLEHHHYRSFQGFLCLMQISTRDEDFLIDTIALRNELHVLNEYFTDPERVKVLHGADRDVLWLQRDLGLYLVNMFDTGQASRVLNYSQKSLAYLLKTHCKVAAQKQYQQADWRIRPLPTVLVNYAREDTHYLLYVYDILRAELIDQTGDDSAMQEVYNRSDDICLKTFSKEIFTELRYLDVIRNLRVELSPPEKRVFAALYDWRDRTARTEDESTGYVLPNKMLLSLARAMPQTINDMSSCIHPIPDIVRRYASDVMDIISQAETSTTQGNDDNDNEQKNDSTATSSTSSTSATSASASSSSSTNTMKRALDSLKPFQPIGSIDALHPMEIDASGSLSPMQKRHKALRHKSGGNMSLEEIYTFAGWMPHTWLDPSNKSGTNGMHPGEAKVSSANAQYQTTGLLPSSTPLGWNNERTERNHDDQIQAIRQTIHMNTGGSTIVNPTSNTTNTASAQHQQQQQLPQDDAELIPRSMSDIYKISIQNRNKRDNNKTESNQSNNDVEDEKFDDVDLDDDTPMFSKPGAAPKNPNESDVEFMTRLGWVEQGTEMYGRVKRAEAMGSSDPKHGSNLANTSDSDLKKQRRRTKQRGKKNTASNESYDYGQTGSSYGAGQHGSDPNRLHNKITKGSSPSGRRGGRGGRSSRGGGRGGRGGRNMGGGSSSSRNGRGRSKR